MAHVAKACQGVSFQERERFLSEIQHGKTSAKSKKVPSSTAEPVQAVPELSGLEALAEVSRHHGQQSLQNELGGHPTDFLGNDSTATSNALSMQSTAAPPFMGLGPLRNMSLGDSNLRNAAMQALVPPQAGLFPLEGEDSLVDYMHGEAPTIGLNYSRHAIEAVTDAASNSPEATDDLVDYNHGQASDGEESHAHHHEALPVRNTIKDVANMSGVSSLAQHPSIQDDHSTSLLPNLATTSAPAIDSNILNATTSAPATSNIDASSFSFMSGLDGQDTQFQMWNPEISSAGQPKKVRGAFAPDRRTAVKEVRKKGACLRCRMLKKSCDSADPCNECAKLENARMWKGQCVRTRLAQIFNVFSSTLFMNIAHKAMEDVRATSSFASLPGRLEVSYFPSAGISVTFPCMRVTGPGHRRATIVLNTENEGVGVGSTFDSKISQYGLRLLGMHMNDATAHVLFGHISKFMYHTLRVALTMTSCVLVARAIDLFMCVLLLAKEEHELLAIHEPRLPPTNAPVDMGHSALQHGEGVHYIYIQLRRKLERACDVHFKAIMTELEKSLIQRKQADNFETFVGTVILLRCLEKVAYVYKGFDHLVDPLVGARRDVLYGAESWPLENPPSHYWQQGERFSDLLVSMLRLRRVLPVMKIRDGMIKTDSPDKNVREWFEAMSLRADVLQFARDKPYDSIDGNSWELRWMGKVFESQ